MDERDQYIEALTELVEQNLDHKWVSEFRSLRAGGFLPGGGAGSLNDWGPVFSGTIQNAWYSNLYGILRFLFDHDLAANRIREYQAIAESKNIHILRCLSCGVRYHHPSRFESHISLDFYDQNFSRFVDRGQLKDILKPDLSFQSEEVNKYRNWLSKQYQRNDIKIYDFVAAKYICPGCAKGDFKTRFEIYELSKDEGGQKRFQLRKEATQEKR